MSYNRSEKKAHAEYKKFKRVQDRAFMSDFDLAIKNYKKVPIVNNASEFEECYVLYLDVLGFGAEVQEADESRMNNLLDFLKGLHDGSKKISENSKSTTISVLSDSIIVSLPCKDVQFGAVVVNAIFFQNALLYAQRFLTRGYISKGMFFHKDGVIFGKPLVTAVTEEKKIGNYPYIFIDPVIAQNETDVRHRLLKSCGPVSPEWYVDFLDNSGPFLENLPRLSKDYEDKSMTRDEYKAYCLELAKENKSKHRSCEKSKENKSKHRSCEKSKNVFEKWSEFERYVYETFQA